MVSGRRACSSSIGTASVSASAPCASNGGTADGLRQDLLGNSRERLMVLAASGRGFSLSSAAPASRAGSSGRPSSLSESFEIVKNRLLD